MPIENDVLAKWIAEKLPEGHPMKDNLMSIIDIIAFADGGMWRYEQIATGLICDAVSASVDSSILIHKPYGATHWAVAFANQTLTSNGPTRYLAARAACEAVMGHENNP